MKISIIIKKSENQRLTNTGEINETYYKKPNKSFA